ncbi:hypothetical protein CYMTET_25137 [Cymbomonas tetramitiformis]|uniref:Apple domain-containing protein n=1 Tax=Cymbomonas tetramitiformis TaxID=36881 RepID=A0AAE0KZH5_9CHLO|nr:hypothetical protein CYMTET_25137 [Cymbomonas tetramitiformis]
MLVTILLLCSTYSEFVGSSVVSKRPLDSVAIPGGVDDDAVKGDSDYSYDMLGNGSQSKPSGYSEVQQNLGRVKQSLQAASLTFAGNRATSVGNLEARRRLTSHITGQWRLTCPSQAAQATSQGKDFLFDCYNYFSGICDLSCTCCVSAACYCGLPRSQVARAEVSQQGISEENSAADSLTGDLFTPDEYEYTPLNNFRCKQAYLVSKEAYDVTFLECQGSCDFDSRCNYFLHAAGTCYKHADCNEYYTASGFITHRKNANKDADITYYSSGISSDDTAHDDVQGFPPTSQSSSEVDDTSGKPSAFPEAITATGK